MAVHNNSGALGATVEDSAGSAAPDGAIAHEGGPFDRSNVQNTVLLFLLFGFTFAVFPALAVLLNELANENRLEVAHIGTGFVLLGMVKAGSTLLYGLQTRFQSNRVSLAICCVSLAMLTLAMQSASGVAVLVVCALLGLPLGVMLSIAMGGIVSYGQHAVRLQGLNVLVFRAMQLVLTLVLTETIVPTFAANGGFAFLTAIYCGGAILFATLYDKHFGTVLGGKLPKVGGIGALGTFALIGAILIFAAKGALFPYIIPLTRAAGLDVGAARLGLSVFIAGQLTGAVVVTFFAFAGRYLRVLTGALVLILLGAAIVAYSPSISVFYSCLFGLAVALTVKDIFVMPMLMSLDPSLRAARQAGAASLTGEAILGPLIAGALVVNNGAQGSITATCGFIIAGMAIIYVLEFYRARVRAH
jgi:hypothetical protein